MRYDYSQEVANQLLEEEVERTMRLEMDLEHTKSAYAESDAEVERLTARLEKAEAERDRYRHDLARALMASGDDVLAGETLFETWEEIAALAKGEK